ncbi:MAG: hypothetical protein GF411_03720 [Candidatus Lokiarchaeota archaeon]|nr:hypothetical protein [Candidatus Lokiarchaeota archaeon]
MFQGVPIFLIRRRFLCLIIQELLEMRQGTIFLLGLIFLLLLAAPVNDTTMQLAEEDNGINNSRDFSTSYTSHATISINGDAAFASAGFPGYGNSTHPYIIEGYFIESSSECIRIQSTTVYYVIRDCYISSPSFSANYGIILLSAPNGAVEDTYIENHDTGMVSRLSNPTTVVNVTVVGAASRGIYFWDSDNSVVNNSNLISCDIGIDSFSSVNSVIFNNTVIDSISRGISASSSTDSMILNNSINTSWDYGIYVASSDGTCIAYNTVTDCIEMQCIRIANSENIELFGNYVEMNEISLENSPNAIIENNTVINSGFFITGSGLTNWLHSVSGNTVNGLQFGYFNNTSNLEIDLAQYGQLIFANCSNITAKDGAFSNTGCGVEVGYCDNVTIRNITIIDAYDRGLHGVFGYLSDFCTIDDVTIGNYTNGVSCFYCDNATITQSTFLDNYNGIKIENSEDYEVSGNEVNSCENDGIYLDTATNATVIGNQVYDTNDYAFNIFTVSESNITGNF